MPIGEQSSSLCNTKHYLSVVIPTHARASSVGAVLGALAKQDLAPNSYEILVVSNFADAELDGVIEKFQAASDLNVRGFVTGEIGVNRARNLGLREASGENVLFLDDDCYPANPAYLSRLLAFHREFPGYAALGGAYLSPSGLNGPGRHYNWICNQWLEAQFIEPRETTRLIGGAVSYKLSVLRELGLEFDAGIRYGGTETEFHQRLERQGLKMLFHPELSVVHDPHMGSVDLVRKAFSQGMGKARREPVESAKSSRAKNFWDEWLSNSFHYDLYRQAFAAGERAARRGWEVPANRAFYIWFFIRFCLAVGITYGPLRQRRVRKALSPAYERASLIYWRFYHYAWEAVGLARRFVGLVRRLIGFVHGRFWRVVGQLHRFVSYVHNRSVRTYWTLYPIGYHLRRNWWKPWTLLDETRMPLTYPSLDLRSPALWVAGLDSTWSKEKIESMSRQYAELGIESVQLEGVDAGLAQRLQRHGLKYHFIVRPYAELDTAAFPAGTEFIARVAISELHSHPDKMLDWVRSLPKGIALHLKIDTPTSRRILRGFLSALKAEKRIGAYSFEMPKPATASLANGFSYFRWLYRFSDQVEALQLRWRHLYRFEPDGRYPLSFAEGETGNPPELSVIIPHHRDLENLAHVLCRLNTQSVSGRSFEVVVVDNAVEADLIPEAARRGLILANPKLDLRILTVKALSRDHYLSGHARNFGVLNSRGAKLLFLDSDILVGSEFIANLLKRLNETDVIMAKRQMLVSDFAAAVKSVEDIEPSDVYREDDYWEGYKAARQWTDLADYWKYSCTYCFALKRENWLRSGPFDPQFMMYGFEDVDLGFRLYRRGLRFGFINDTVYHLYPRKDLHNYHLDGGKRAEALARSALTFFLLRPERQPFSICQGYFAPTFRNWVLKPFRALGSALIPRPLLKTAEPADTEAVTLHAP